MVERVASVVVDEPPRNSDDEARFVDDEPGGAVTLRDADVARREVADRRKAPRVRLIRSRIRDVRGRRRGDVDGRVRGDPVARLEVGEDNGTLRDVLAYCSEQSRRQRVR